MQLNQRTFHNLLLHLECWHTKMCTLIRYTICDSVVKIQYFRHECSSIKYENTKKTQQNQGANHNWQSHLAYRYIRLCESIRYRFYESIVKLCLIKHKCRSFLWYFFRHRVVLSTCLEKLSKTKNPSRKDELELYTVLFNMSDVTASYETPLKNTQKIRKEYKFSILSYNKRNFEQDMYKSDGLLDE